MVRKRFYDEEMERKLDLPKLLLIMFGVYHEVEINKFINHHLCNSDSILRVRFEDLKNSRKKTIKKICRFLNIEFKSSLLESQFEPNSSFCSEKERNSTLNKKEEKFISLMAKLLSILPYPIFRLLRPLKMKMMKSYLGYGLPDWFYSIQKSKIEKTSQFK